MNNDDSSLNGKFNYLNHLDNNNNIDDENESKTYYENGAHFRYKDLFKKLLKIKKEREEKERKEKEVSNKKIINNNIIINNNLNFNLFNNKNRGVSRNIKINDYLNSFNKYDEISKTFISYIAFNQYKSVFLPSIENIQKKISNYLNILEMEKIKNINKQNNKINYKNLDKTAKYSKSKKNKNLRDKFKIQINLNNKEKKSTLSTKICKKIKSPDKNAINLKKNRNIMNTLPFKYNINKNINSYIFKRIKEIFKHKKNGNWTKQISKQVTKSKSPSKSRTKSKSNSKNKNKNRKTIFRNGNKFYNNLNQFTKYTDKTTTINLRYKNNNFCSKKFINQNYTTKIICNKKRKINVLNFSNSEKKRKAHSSSAGKSQKYDLNSLIHNNNLYTLMNERKIKSPLNKIKKNYKSNFLYKKVYNIVTLNNYQKNNYKTNTKIQLFKNSMNLNSVGASIIKAKDSKDHMKSENNISKSNSKIKNNNINIINNNSNINKIINIKSTQVKRIKSINDYNLKQSNRKTLKKLKTVSPLKITFIFKNTNNKLHGSSNIYNNKKKHIYINCKFVNNKSLDSQKILFKRKKIKEISSNSKSMKSKSKNKILSRNNGATITNNNMATNKTNIKINSKDIFNSRLNCLTLSNMRKMKQKLSRNITSNLSSFLEKKKKSKLINNTNSYLNDNKNSLYKNKGALSTNYNNSNLIKKDTFIRGSKSKKNIYLANNMPTRKNIKKKIIKFLD